MGTEVWQAVEGLAAALADTPALRNWVKELPRNEKRGPLPQFLQELQAGGVKVASYPFRAGNLADFVPQLIGRMGKPPDAATWTLFEAWRRDAESITHSVHRLVQWIRSRLPGYPSILAPQLCPGSPMMVQGLHGEITWQVGERSKGLEKAPAPRSLGPDFSGTVAGRVEGAAVRLAHALQASESWLELRRGLSALTSEDEAQLRDVRRHLCRALSEEQVNAFESENLLRRTQYRQNVVADALESLVGAAREYAFAFRDAEELLTFAAVDVAGQFAAYGEPTVLGRVSDLQFDPGPPRTVAFVLAEPPMLDVCRLVRLSDPLVPETLFITSMTINMTQAHGLSQGVTARVLE